MSNNTTNSTTIDNEELIGKQHQQYKGPRKLVWENGRQIMQPDLEAISQGTPGALQSYFVGKTLDDAINDNDIKQFENLKTDSDKYQMITNMITHKLSILFCYMDNDP